MYSAISLFDSLQIQQTANQFFSIRQNGRYGHHAEMSFHKMALNIAIKKDWDNFVRNCTEIKTLSSTDKKFLDWIYRYKPSDSQVFLIYFFKPTNNDYQGKLLHVYFSINYLFSNISIIKNESKKGFSNEVIETTDRKEFIEKMYSAWYRHEADKKKKNKFNELSVKLPNSTLQKLNDLLVTDTTNKKDILQEINQVIIEKIETLHEEKTKNKHANFLSTDYLPQMLKNLH